MGVSDSLTGVLSSCRRRTAASSRPSYSAWLWSRFLKTLCRKTPTYVKGASIFPLVATRGITANKNPTSK